MYRTARLSNLRNRRDTRRRWRQTRTRLAANRSTWKSDDRGATMRTIITLADEGILDGEAVLVVVVVAKDEEECVKAAEEAFRRVAEEAIREAKAGGTSLLLSLV